jgi:anaerobic selenocysteine-containing dehydrogenase
LAGWRGEDGEATGRGAPNPGQLERYIENGSFFLTHIPDEARFFKPFNAAYQDWAVKMGFFDKPMPYLFQLYVEPIRKFQLAAEGHGDRQPPEHLRAQVKAAFDPLPVWWQPFEEAAVDPDEYPLHAITQRPAAMYHSWGTQNAWLRQIHGCNPLYVHGSVLEAHGLKDGDWAHVVSHHGRIKAPVARMDALNPHTVWTWNAIGKSEGAWALDPKAPEAQKGFLLNHLIHELLPPKSDGLRWSNSDPITGQAAWYDLRVRIEKAEAGEEISEPRMGRQKSPVGQGPKHVAHGEGWK